MRGINDKGQIVGFSGTFPGFLYSGGAYTTLTGPPGSIDTYATGINNRGEIVGFQFGNGPGNGFLYSGGTYTTISVPGKNVGTGALGINDRGQIVGFYETFGAGQFVANSFLYSGGIYTTLSVPLVALTHMSPASTTAVKSLGIASSAATYMAFCIAAALTRSSAILSGLNTYAGASMIAVRSSEITSMARKRLAFYTATRPIPPSVPSAVLMPMPPASTTGARSSVAM